MHLTQGSVASKCKQNNLIDCCGDFLLTLVSKQNCCSFLECFHSAGWFWRANGRLAANLNCFQRHSHDSLASKIMNKPNDIKQNFAMYHRQVRMAFSCLRVWNNYMPVTIAQQTKSEASSQHPCQRSTVFCLPLTNWQDYFKLKANNSSVCVCWDQQFVCHLDAGWTNETCCSSVNKHQISSTRVAGKQMNR